MTPLTLPPALPPAPAAPLAPTAPVGPIATGVSAGLPPVGLSADSVAALPSFDAISRMVAKTAPSPKARPQSPVVGVTAQGQQSIEWIGQTLATILPQSSDAPVAEDRGKPKSPSVTPALPDPLVAALLATLPQLPPVNPDPTLAEAAAIKSVGTAAVAAARTGPIVFQEESTAKTEATNFAEDLILALNTITPSPVASDPKTLAKADAPVLVDHRPKLDMTGNAWLDQLARDITASATSDGKLSFRIVPPQLGRLDITIETRDAGVSVHMKTETREAHLLIANAQHRLEEALGAQSIRVTETSVTSNGGGDLPRPQFRPQNPLIEAVTETKREADAPTNSRDAGRFA